MHSRLWRLKIANRFPPLWCDKQNYQCLYRLQEGKILLLMPDTCLETPVSSADLKWIEDNGGRRGFHLLVLEYHHFTARAVLTAVLPEDVKEIPTGFEVIGHIAHFNLRSELLPYKRLIGMWTEWLAQLTVQIMGPWLCRGEYENGLHGFSHWGCVSHNGHTSHTHFTRCVPEQLTTCTCMRT